MSGLSAIQALHKATTGNEPIKLYAGGNGDSNAEAGSADSNIEVDSIKDATHVKLGNNDKLYDLSSVTNFYNEDEAQTLKAVIFSWLHDKSSIVDYKNQCAEFGIPDFKFLVKTELNTWLSGNSDSCKFLKDEAESNGADTAAAVTTTANGAIVNDGLDHEVENILKQERDSLNHNAALRGSKNLDFGYLVSDAKKFINLLKRSSSTANRGSNRPQSKTAPKKQPIIIVSPASTALLSLSNIKDFLEGGRFTEPNQQNRPPNGLTILNHPSDRVVSTAQKIMVVDNVEMFNKPEYWDRVIAIFTSGQEWQFAKYKYSKPEILFQNFHGFYVSYNGDPTPAKIKDWNVSEIKVDRGDKRFRDKMIVKDFWAEIDKLLVAKGYGA